VLRRRRARAGDKWHLDAVALKIRGKRHWLFTRMISSGVIPRAGSSSIKALSGTQVMAAISLEI
jgi:hypothetical protein